MAAAGWYYAQGDEEKGPVSTGQLKKLAESGQLAPSDLVWQEGMEEWVPATNVPGVFPNSPAAPSPGGARPGLPGADAMYAWARVLSHPLLLAGLLLAIWARGCDTLNERNTQRLQAKATLAQMDFEAEYAEKRAELEQERQDILDEQAEEEEEESDDSAESDDSDAEEESSDESEESEELQEVNKKLADLSDEEAKERAELERDDWRELQAAAESADERATAWSYWHEFFFLLATFMLVTGLVGIAYAFAGPQRWIALVLLAIVLLSLYGGGIRLSMGA